MFNLLAFHLVSLLFLAQCFFTASLILRFVSSVGVLPILASPILRRVSSDNFLPLPASLNLPLCSSENILPL